jgi:hypothetical protein
MDCRTARNLLDFNRPHAPELDRIDQDLLEGHLAHCPECDTLARNERQLDEYLGEAVRDVPVPQGLHERILRRLREEREGWYRKQLGRGLRVFAAAAALFLVGWFGLSAWRQHHLPQPTEKELAEEFDPDRPPDRADAEAWFLRQGVKTNAPADFAYQYLSPNFLLKDFRGQKVPCLTFIRQDGEQPRAVAHVFILSRERFDLGNLSELSKPYSTRFKVEIRKPSSDYAYVIVYSGNLNLLLKPESSRN